MNCSFCGASIAVELVFCDETCKDLAARVIERPKQWRYRRTKRRPTVTQDTLDYKSRFDPVEKADLPNNA